MDPKEQSFDFTHESNQQEQENWKKALKAIPLPPKDFWFDGISSLKEEDMVGTKFSTCYQFFTFEEDTWFWLTFLFKGGDVVEVGLLNNYMTPNKHEWIPIVNNFFEKYGLPTPHDLNVWEIKKMTWQEVYDLLCLIARDTKIPLCSVE